MKQLLCQLFSSQCHLTSLRLHMSHCFTKNDIHECFTSDCIQYEHQSFCLTLRRLHLRIIYIQFFEALLNHVPNLEKLSVQFEFPWAFDISREVNFAIMKQSNENWFNKVRRKYTLSVLFKKSFHIKYCSV